ncbi:uncharacterized protein BDZ99DRAFT_9877 [Mytilinidion resinicola]|uniref:Uncharacterized protein n=1 Tax=Mytilinidion resinicola TaxID=574789 RepID=A0A6A6ZA40_9PEZI|nr:uncharacterized protein BDZ99DRAFT_9877 [Mytilinidion resinicola]KAF2817145.1 hypothetical protein BDZ99DRAFT_9877 [Mytilinidion resinicola]
MAPHRFPSSSHSLQCGHTINTRAANVPCGTDCVCPGSEAATNPPFLCTACLETHYLTGYFAIKARFRAEYPSSAWTIIDEFKVGAILRLCAQLEKEIMKRIPGLQEGIGNIGALLAQAPTEEQDVDNPRPGKPEDENGASVEPEYERYECWVTEYLEWIQKVVYDLKIDPEIDELVRELTREVKMAKSRIQFP